MSFQHVTGGNRPRISVVVATYRRPDRCERLIGALAAQTLGVDQFEVIVVDDGSGDETPQVLNGLVDDVPFSLRALVLDTNGGQGRARNLGCEHSSADYLAFTDDDCVPHPDWLAAGLRALESDPAVGVVQGSTTEPPHFAGRGLPRWQHRQHIVSPTPFLESCNIFYRKSAFCAAGGFDPVIGTWGEDVALGWSVLEAGWSRSFADEALVYHDVQIRGWAWHMKTGFMEQNLIRIAARHPMFRREVFWRPWAYRKRDAAFVLAAASALAAVRKPGLLAGVLPYAWIARESPRQPKFAQHVLQLVAVDAARSAGHLSGAVKNRMLVI